MLGRKLACGLLLSVGLFSTATFAGPSTDYVLNAGSASALVGGTVTSQVLLDVNASELQGWSYGVCHDGTMVTLMGVASGLTTMTVNGGDEPSFEAINDMPVGGDGYTVGVVIDFFGVNTLGIGTGYEVGIGTYILDAEGTSNLDFCSNLGMPPVETLVVVAGGSVVPGQNSGTLEGTLPPPIEVTFDAQDATIEFDLTGATVSPGLVTVLMTNEDPLAEVQGFSFGLIDGADVDLVDINVDGTATAAVNGGAGPDFAALTPMAAGGDGGTCGVVISLSPPFDVIPPGTAQPIVNFVYEASATATNGATVNLDFTDTLGMPAVALVAVIDGNTVAPITDGGTLTLVEVVEVFNDYLRGDANADGQVNIADGIWILNFLWQAGPESPCAAAEDVNDDGMGDTSDAMYIFNYRLLGGPAPLGAFPGCDTALEEDCGAATPSCP